MKILIAGEFDSISQKLANKFYKEGHEVVVIGDGSSERTEAASEAKYKFYDIKASSPECEKIFETRRFNTVIYLSEDKDAAKSFKDENISQECNVSKLVNLLNLSEKNGVGKFVLLSSAAVYGNAEELPANEEMKPNPVSPYGMSNYVKEYYCIKWSETYNLKTLCLRISNVYGPEIQPSNGSGLISIFIQNILNEKEIIIDGYGTQTRDFLYIDDLIEGIYKAASSQDCLGIFNLSSNTEYSINSVVDLISAFKKPKKVIYREKQRCNIPRSRLDNTKIMNILAWEPKIILEEGLKKTYEWQESLKKKPKVRKGVTKRVDKPAKKFPRNIIAYFENITLFLIIAFLQWGNLIFNIKLPDLKIDYSIIYIIIMGIMWGQTQAYIAIFLSAALYFGANLFSGVDIVTFVYTPENLLRIAVYILVGIVTGYSIERKNRNLESKDIALESLKNKYTFLLDVYNETRIVKNELENQVIDTEDSFSVIYRIIQEVDSLEIEKVFSGAISAIEKIMKTNQVSIYTLNNDGTNSFMRLKARSLALDDKVPNSIRISDFAPILEVIESKSMYVNRKLDPNIPVIIAPVLEDRNVIAVVSIHKTAFENLTMHYENLFQTIIGLITNALKRAYFFEASLKDKRYVENTRILTSQTFEKILAEIRNNKEELGMSYTLLKVNRIEESFKEISDKVISGIRDNDYIGLNNDENIYVLLSNTKNNYANLVIERLKNKGIDSSLVEEVFEDG